MRQIVAEDIAREHAKLSEQATQQVMESALSNIFYTGYTEAENGLKKASYKIIETVITHTTKKGTLGEVFDRSIDQ